MTKATRILWVFVFFCWATQSSVLAEEVFVSSAQAPLYDDSSSGAVVVGHVKRGARLVTTGRRSGDWIQVQAPETVSCWVFGELVKGDRIGVTSVKARSGPGVGYASLGTLHKGDPVERRGVDSGWVELAAPSTLAVWVEQSQVSRRAVVDLTAKPVRSEAVAPEEAPASPPPAPEKPVRVVRDVKPKPPAPKPKPVVAAPSSPSPVKPWTAPKRVSPPLASPQTEVAVVRRPSPRIVSDADGALGAPSVAPVARPSASLAADLNRSPQQDRERVSSRFFLINHYPQGGEVMLRGVVRPTGFRLFAPSRYRLVSDELNLPARTVCYLLDDDLGLGRYVGQSVSIRARKYWIYGVSDPVVVVNAINR